MGFISGFGPNSFSNSASEILIISVELLLAASSIGFMTICGFTTGYLFLTGI